MDIEEFFTLDDNSWIDEPSEMLTKKSIKTVVRKRKPLTTEQKETINSKKCRKTEEATKIKDYITIINDLNNRLIDAFGVYENNKVEYFKLSESLIALKEENNKYQIKLEFITDEYNKLIVIHSKSKDEYNTLQTKLDDTLEENVTLKIKLNDMEVEYGKFETTLDKILASKF